MEIGICKICNHIGEIRIHHISYKKNITIPLCLKCHYRVHHDPDFYSIYKPIDHRSSRKKKLSQDLHELKKNLKLGIVMDEFRQLDKNIQLSLIIALQNKIINYDGSKLFLQKNQC